MKPLKVGDRIRDNDPRVTYERVLTVWDFCANETHVLASDRSGAKFRIQIKRIFLDGKPRRTGFSRV